MTTSSDPALLVDGHNMIFRAFTSVPRTITAPGGDPVNGVYGLVGTLLRLIRDYRPAYVAVAFDIPEVPTYRHKLFPAYQGQRGPLGGADAENFAWQVERAKEVLDLMHLKWLAMPGFEADDVLGTLASVLTAGAVSSLIVSTDRDLQQLVGPCVTVLIPGKQPVLVGPADVRTRLGVPPERIVDWKVLAGDPSDNIPGVPGIGNKSAMDLVQRFGSWMAVYDHLDQLPQRQRSALTAGRAGAEVFAEVVRIHCDLPLNCAAGDLRFDGGALPARPGDALRLAGLRPEESGA